MTNTPNKLNICAFISGRGSNLKAIIDACENNPEFPARVSCIISNKPDAGGIEYAKEFNIPFAVISHKDFNNKQDFEAAILDALSHEPVDLICLAGFMRILSPYFINQWGPNIINIHPSLLPKYKGLDTHERAIKAGDSEAGCTVHYVIPEMDAGDIIVQRKVPILKSDTIESLEQKVLVQEHTAYPEAIKVIADNHFKKPEPTPTKVSSKQQTELSENNWINFTNFVKYGTIATIGALILLALLLL